MRTLHAAVDAVGAWRTSVARDLLAVSKRGLLRGSGSTDLSRMTLITLNQTISMCSTPESEANLPSGEKWVLWPDFRGNPC